MTVGQAIARGYNFFVEAFLGIIGGSLVTEPFQEDEWLFKLDDLAVMTIAAVGILWYLTGKNRFTRSSVPLGLAAAAVLAKVFALVVERNDRADVGDDIGYIVVLSLFLIVAAVAAASARRQMDLREASA